MSRAVDRLADGPVVTGAYLLEAEFDAVPDRSVELVGTLVVARAAGGALDASIDAVLRKPAGPVAVTSVRDLAVTAEHGLRFTLDLPAELLPDLRRDRASERSAAGERPQRGERGAWVFRGMLPGGSFVGPFAAAGRHDAAGARAPDAPAAGALGAGSWYLTALESAHLPPVRPPRGKRR